MHFPGQIILGELEKSCNFARDLLEIGCYRGTAIAVPYGVLSSTPLQRNRVAGLDPRKACREQLWLFRRMHFPGQIILGELGGACDFARNLLKIGCYRRNGHSRSLRVRWREKCRPGKSRGGADCRRTLFAFENVGAIIDRPPKNSVFRIFHRKITAFFA